jgi:acetyl esterase/lipase
VEKQVDADYPKTFVWTCEDDSLVPPSNAVHMAQALEEKQIPHLFKLYPQGEHGFALAQNTSAKGWVDEMLEFMK